MTAKQIAFDIEAREQMLKGVQKLAKAVKTTLGPSGRVVILEKSFGAPNVNVSPIHIDVSSGIMSISYLSLIIKLVES